MEKRPFLDSDIKPVDSTLKSTLDNSYSYYESLMGIADSYLKDWNFSKSSGWMLKVHDKNKALFYIIPLKGEFKVSMAIRENERNAFLEDNDLEAIQGMIKSAKKYREGYALRFDIKNSEDFKIVKLLIKKLIDL
ncbi:MAG TPA: DUF3788 family protein, partial [Methanobacteriaceae archaeon]|nr:DUF3788 family protein [Methanobacteriaceae archaeon]